MNGEKQHITRILLPEASADAVVAAFIARQYGSKLYSGIGSAAIDMATGELADLDFDALVNQGILGLKNMPMSGSGTGLLTLRLADVLTLHRLPELQKIFKWIEFGPDDESLEKHEIVQLMELSELLEELQAGNQPLNAVIEQAFPLLQAHVDQQRRMFYDLPDEWAKIQQQGKGETAQMKNGEEPISVVSVVSDSLDMAEFLFQYKKTKADVVVQQFSDGGINVYTNPASQIDALNVARVLRAEEARRQERDLSENLGFFFNVEGVADLVPEWFYDQASQALLNHSTDTLTLPPTILPLNEVMGAVYIGLGDDVWEQKCPDEGCRGAQCYFYLYGLERCRARELDAVPQLLEEKYFASKNRKSKGGRRQQQQQKPAPQQG